MPSGLRVTRIDRAPSPGPLALIVNGVAIGGLLHRTLVDMTVGSGELLLEVMGARPLVQLLKVAPGHTVRVQIGRRCSLGILDASHYLRLDPPLVGLPDRTLFPLNLSAHTAVEWLQQKRALGEPLTRAQMQYLQSHLVAAAQPTQRGTTAVPSLTELGAFAALGLDADAEETDVREAYRLLLSIHTPETGQQSETTQRLEEAFRVAMGVLKRRARQEVSDIGR